VLPFLRGRHEFSRPGLWRLGIERTADGPERLGDVAGDFNLQANTNWSGVSTTFGSGSFGQIASARDPRKIQLSAKLDF
jgi:hypothetical protein